MFAWFERLVEPYPDTPPATPPRGFFAFLWECARGLRRHIDGRTVQLTSAVGSAVGEPVGAKPVLALPGWYIKRAQRGSVEVINGRDANYLARSGDARLSASLIQRIVHQLDARCRTVEPRAYHRVGS